MRLWQVQDSSACSVLRAALVLLTSLAHRNADVQNIVFTYLDTLLDIKGVESHLATALIEVYDVDSGARIHSN